MKKLHLEAGQAAHRELAIAQELQGGQFQHVIGFVDSGLDAESGAYFVIMPRAECSLQQVLRKKGPFGSAEAVEILLQIATGLGEVPSIVHRDLKPGNVLWHENRWKIADFGIARFVEDATSSETLKGCLSPLYAAPEQWRYERSTNATDIYSLGCIGFELLTGRPPFLENPEKQHQTDPLPAFSCDDSRLGSMITLMTRKNGLARPSVVRVQTVLRDILLTPAVSSISSLAELASVGAAIATAAQKEEAEKAAAIRSKRDREQLHSDAKEILADNIDRLWEKIHLQVPASQRSEWRRNPCFAKFHLGGATIEIGRIKASVVGPGEFRNSGWDVVSYSSLTVRNGSGRQYNWEVSLWFVKRPNESDYRWLEVGYFAPFRHRTSPFAANGYREADLAASRITSGVQLEWPPRPIDAEHEAEFHERCIWLFARAAKGTLREPVNHPINGWPPNM